MPAADPPQPLVKILDVSLSQALEAYALDQVAHGRDIVRVMQRVMAYWMSLAVQEIPRPEREKLAAYLYTVTSRGKSRRPSSVSRLKPAAGPRQLKAAQSQDALRNTVAARIVASLNYYGARRLRRQGQAAQFYRLIQQFIRRRTGSAGLLRSGFIPGFRALKKNASSSDGVKPPPLGAAPGSIRESYTDTAATILVENWAAQRQDGRRRVLGVAGLAPDAFTNAIPNLESLYRDLLLANMRERAAKAGFQTS